MSKRDSKFKPLSLAQHFEAPDDFVGHFGWVCGYSADIGFLDDAIERFTRQTNGQRAYEGRISIALMLDPANPQITPTEVPGVLHSAIIDRSQFKLLHAKVAILGFRHQSDAKRWRLRLIVSTGNWTRQTLEESLDLVWSIDLDSQELNIRDDSVYQASADMRAVWRMMDWLRNKCDMRLLHASPSNREKSNSHAASELVEKWIKKVVRIGKSGVPHFFDNRDRSFLDALPGMIKQHGSTSSRNYLAMGSGFYQTPDGADKIPSVLTKIVDRLRAEGLLTRNPNINIFVNPSACQAVACASAAIDKAGWTIREAKTPKYFVAASRSLHAKFLFGTIDQSNSERCNSAWIYLGSGNLTGPGFCNKTAFQSGNLEAGVVLAPESLRWFSGRGVAPESVVTNVLPIQWDSKFSDKSEALAEGSDLTDPVVLYCAAPVANLFWTADGENGWLRTDEEVNELFDVLDESEQACKPDQERRFSWQGSRPRQVLLRWRVDEKERRAWVPIVDEYGRIAGTILPRIDIEEAWSQLDNFPMPPDDEDLPDEGADGEPLEEGEEQRRSGIGTATYPIRQMMQLIENIAAKQTSVQRVDWKTWCTRLEQCLIQAADDSVLQEFLKLKLNPLSPLMHAPFRPDFAVSSESPEGRRYEKSLKRVEAAWGVNRLGKQGDLR